MFRAPRLRTMSDDELMDIIALLRSQIANPRWLRSLTNLFTPLLRPGLGISGAASGAATMALFSNRGPASDALSGGTGLGIPLDQFSGFPRPDPPGPFFISATCPHVVAVPSRSTTRSNQRGLSVRVSRHGPCGPNRP